MDILDFLLRKWYFSATLITLILLWLWLELRSKGPTLTPNEAVMLVNRKNALILDARTKQAWTDSHISGSKCLDELGAEGWSKKLTKKGKQSRPVVMVCENGSESRKMAEKLRQLGLAETVTLAGGLMRWREEKLPLRAVR